MQSDAGVYLGGQIPAPWYGISVPIVYSENYRTGEAVSTGLITWEFSGLDSVGEVKTGKYEAYAEADSGWGVLKSKVAGTLTNPVVNEGSPSIFEDGWFSISYPEGVPTSYAAMSPAYFLDSISRLDGVKSILIQLGVTAELNSNSQSGMELAYEWGRASPVITISLESAILYV